MCICVNTFNCVWSYSHHTYVPPFPPPPPLLGPLPLHPETQLRAVAGKQARAGGRWDETDSPGQFLSFLVSKGHLARCRRPEMSGPSKSAICLITVGWLQDPEQSQLVASLCLLCTEPCRLTHREIGRPDHSQRLRWSVRRTHGTLPLINFTTLGQFNLERQWEKCLSQSHCRPVSRMLSNYQQMLLLSLVLRPNRKHQSIVRLNNGNICFTD